jgi:hypothetical protein
MQCIYYEYFALHVSTTKGHHQVLQPLYTIIKLHVYITFAYTYCLSVYNSASGLLIQQITTYTA